MYAWNVNLQNNYYNAAFCGFDYMLRGKCYLKKKTIRVFSLCIVAGLIGLIILLDHSNDKDSALHAVPVCAYYQDRLYIYHGKLVHSLPCDFFLIGETDEVPVADIDEDFDSNESGYIYINEDPSNGIYFRWKNWVGSGDEKEPYLFLAPKK